MVSAGHSPAILVTGRTKELSPELKEKFTRFAKSLGLTDDHILFPVPIGNGQLGRRERDMGTVQARCCSPREKRRGTCSPPLVTGVLWEPLWVQKDHAPP